MQALLASEDAEALFVAGCSPNQGKFYPQFDHVVLLTAPTTLLIQRLAKRDNNPFGKDAAEVARVLHMRETVEPALRRSASTEIDTSMALEEVVETVLRLAVPGGRP
jgi:shikimate kinase